MLSFPISPRSGQSYVAPNGQIYVFDGVKWLGTAISGGGGGGTGTGDYSWLIAADDSTQREILAGETVKIIGAGTITTSSDLEGNITITGTGGASAASTYSWSIAADDSTQREIFSSESVKFIGAGGITTASDAEGNITITGNTDYNNLINKPDLASTYQFSVAADDSTQRVISTDELIKFVGAGGITTASDAEGNITITQGTTSSLVNGAYTLSLNSDSTTTIPGNLNLPGIVSAAGLRTSETKIALGSNAGQTSQGSNSVAVGGYAGQTSQGPLSVAIGYGAGAATQGTSSVAVGNLAGSNTQGGLAVAVGNSAGQVNQGYEAVAVGFTTGLQDQGTWSVAIGSYAGAFSQGEDAIAIGRFAGQTNQPDNTIILNATGTEVNGVAAQTNSFYVAPIRNIGGTSGVLQYNAATKEVSYSSDITSEGNINIEVNLTDSTKYIWQFGEDGALTLPPGGTILNSSGQPYVYGVSSINTSVSTSIFTDASGDYQYGTLSYDYAVNGVSNSFSIEYSRPLVGGNVDINVGNTIVNGDLTLSGDIRSEGNINIDINLTDSTLRRWQFGEDGFLTLAGPVTLPNGGELRPSTTAHDTALAAWEFIRGGEIQSRIDNNSVTPEGWPMINWRPTGPTAQGYIDFLNNAKAVQNAGGTLIIYPAISFDFFQRMRSALIAIRDTYNLNAQGVSISSSYAKSWNFSETGDLTIPGDIRSDTGFYVDVNLSDSTLHRWQFGEDGELTVPGPINGLGNSKLDFNSFGANSAYLTTTSDDTTALIMTATTAELYAQTNILIRTNTDETAKVWTFGDDGGLTFPDATVQTTAWTGSGGSSLVNGIYTLSLGSTGNTTFPTGLTLAAARGPSTVNFLSGVDKVFQIETQTAFTSKLWNFGTDGNLTLPQSGKLTFSDGTIQSTAPAITIAADDSTQRTIYLGEESIKFIGAGGITTSSDEEGNITITGGSSLPSQTGNSGKYLTTDGSALSWATVAGGGGGSTLVNGAFTASLESTGNLTIPGDIRSEREINVEINLSDSTLRRWRFGEDGNLTIPGSITTTATTLGLVNATATTINFAGASTTLNIATALTGATSQTVSIATGSNTGTKTINIGTGGNTTNLQLGVAGSGVTTISSSTVVGSAATQTLYNTVATTLNFAGAATALNIGSTTGTITLNGPTVVGSQTTQNLYNTVATTVNEFGAATTINVATNAASGTTWTLGNSANTNTLTVAGGTSSGTDSITSTVTTGVINLFTGLTTGTLNIATGGASAVVIGGTGSTVTVGNGLTVVGAFNSTATAGVTAVNFNTEQLTLTGNRIATTVTNSNLELECNGTGGVVINNVAPATTASTATSVGYLGIPASTVTTTNTLTIADAGEHVYVNTSGQTITIPANSSVSYPVGTTLTFIAGPSSSTVTIAITTDTMYLAGTGTTGSRTLAAHGMATAVKVASTTWYINGTGLT